MMEFVKLKVRLRDDPKVIGLSDKAFRAFICAMCWAGDHETDGELPPGLLSLTHTKELREAGLLDGNTIHNWGKHQTTHAEMDAKRTAGRKAARTRWSNPTPNTEVEEEVRGRELEPEPPLRGPNENGNALAAALLAPDSIAQHLISGMSEQWQHTLTSGVLMKLGKLYGPSPVIAALGNIRDANPSPEDPYPYFEKACRRLEEASGV